MILLFYFISSISKLFYLLIYVYLFVEEVSIFDVEVWNKSIL